MPSRLCQEPGCPNPPTGKGRCDFHRKPIERDRSARRREATRGTYKTRRWQLRRMQIFSRDPFCMDGRVSRRVEKVVGYPPLSEMSGQQRRELHEALLDADSFEDLPGKWQAAILEAEANRPKLRLVSDA
jgi:hypothetical protein